MTATDLPIPLRAPADAAKTAGRRPEAIPSGFLDQAVARALHLHQQGKLQEAAEGYRRVLRAEPAHAEANHLLGLVMHQSGQQEDAAKLIGRAVEAQPHNAIYRSNLGVVFKELGRFEDAVASYEAAIEIDPSVPELHSNLGVALLALKRPEDAAAAQRQALALRPDYAEAHANLGLALVELRQHEEAAESFRRAIAVRPDYANAHLYLGQALEALGDLEAAEQSCARAVELKPMNPAAHHALGSVQMRQREFEAAAGSFQRAVQLRPAPEAYRNLGNVLSDLGRPLEAARAYNAALAADPKDAHTLALLGGAQFGLGQIEEAMETYEKVLAIDPKDASSQMNLGVGYLSQGRLEEARQLFEKSIEIDPTFPNSRSGLLFLSNYLGTGDVQKMAADARYWGELVESKARRRLHHDNDPTVDRKLRVGVVSGDLRMHPVGFFTARVFEELDPEKVALYVYSTQPAADEMTERFKRVAAGWHQAFLMNDNQLEATILEDKIDILIDLVGHTAGNRLLAFARKPAPVAFTWLGYFATTGLTAMDYVLCNRWVIPENEESQWVEKPWRMPDTYLCFTAPRAEVPVGTPPVLGNGYVTFGSANNLNKLSDQTVAAWAGVLEAVPTSRLLLRAGALKDENTRELTWKRFTDLGIPRERIVLEGPTSPYDAHLRRYNAVDIALDCFPYAGGTTTVEALFMGVPVLTLKGDRYVSHMGESILNNVGMPEWVAENHDDYVARAKAFAADVEGLTRIRAGLRDRIQTSPLADAPRFARNLEEAFRGMWRIWCEQQSQGTVL